MELRISKESGLKFYSKLLALETNYYEEHIIKHPADVFIESITKLSLCLDELLIVFNAKNTFCGSSHRAISNYILELDSFYDRLFLIMKGLSPKRGKDNKNNTLWLKGNNPQAYTAFLGATAKPHGIIRKMSNGIKHDALNVGFLKISDHESREVKGFYLGKVVGEKGLHGPCPDIHPEYKGAATAISYDYFLRQSAGFLAACLFHLDKIFLSDVKKVTKSPCMILYNFFDKLKGAKNLIFPNEYGMALAEVQTENLSIKIKYPTKIKKTDKTDMINGVNPQFLFNPRTKSSSNQYPYLKLLDL